MRLFKRISIVLLLLLVLAIGILFSVQNTSPAPLDLLFIQFSPQPLALWVLLAFVLGGIIGMLVSSVAIVSIRTQLTMLQRKYKASQKALDKQNNNAALPSTTKP